MPSNEKKIPLIVILGPTAMGKTEIAIETALQVDGEIISADSRLFYRGMDIGTAKPTFAQRECVAHHLIDVAAPDETWNLARFIRAADEVIIEIWKRGKIPILVGGTGQFIRAFTAGWIIPPSGPNPRLRKALENWALEIGSQGLHQRLAVIDPEAANSIDAANIRRTIRALEVIFQCGQRFSALRKRAQPPYALLQIGLHRPRKELYKRIDDRIQEMLSMGFLQEVEGLLNQGYSAELPCFSAIGYKQLIDHYAGKITLDEAVAQMKRLSRQFVRRQANWFKADDPQIHWFMVSDGTLTEVVGLIQSFLVEQTPPY